MIMVTIDEGVQRRITEVSSSDIPAIPPPLSADYLSMTPSVITELDGIDVHSNIQVHIALDAAMKRLGRDLVISVSGRRPRGSVVLMTDAALIICQDCAGLVKDRHGYHLANGVPACSCPAA